jgi:cytochrome P450
MLTLDSTLRESMRLWGFVSRGLLKKVVAKKGVRLPSGEFLPCGTNVGFHQYPVHRDEDVYHCAGEFRPLRFVTEGGNGVRKGVPLVQTSGTFLGFSHGRHAWYASFPSSHTTPCLHSFLAS